MHFLSRPTLPTPGLCLYRFLCLLNNLICSSLLSLSFPWDVFRLFRQGKVFPLHAPLHSRLFLCGTYYDGNLQNSVCGVLFHVFSLLHCEPHVRCVHWVAHSSWSHAWHPTGVKQAVQLHSQRGAEPGFNPRPV